MNKWSGTYFGHMGGARRAGKSTVSEVVLEAALNAGKRVLVARPGCTTIQKRCGHLTSITTVHSEKEDSHGD